MADSLLLENFKKWSILQNNTYLPEEESRGYRESSTRNGEKNIEILLGTEFIPLYNMNGVISEAENWFASLPLHTANCLIVLGIGLGSYYQAAKKWLKENPKRRIIFLEPRYSMIQCFFSTELASEFLEDSQAWLFHLPFGAPEEITVYGLISNNFYFMEMEFSSLRLYSELYNKEFSKLKNALKFILDSERKKNQEYANSAVPFFSNFFTNVPRLADAYSGNLLFEKFKDSPAIITGAGPSLDLNIDALKQLKEHAIIFAGGTAMNALNAKFFLPHFGMGIDPNTSQFSRVLANDAFEVPFFYISRMNYEALSVVEGDLLYLAKDSHFTISKWMEDKLKIPGKATGGGVNVINYTLNVAEKLGCNPLIVVGVDLSYKQDKSYAENIRAHALHDPKKYYKTKAEQDEIIPIKDINGNTVLTLWKWINESSWYTTFAKKHPEVKIINSTEGGIGFGEIENKPLKEVAEEYLKESIDYMTLIAGEIQNAAMPEPIDTDQIDRLLYELKARLQNIIEMCKRAKNVPLTAKNYFLPDDLKEEIKDILPEFDQFVSTAFFCEWRRAELDIYLGREEGAKKIEKLYIARLDFLIKTAESILKTMEFGFKFPRDIPSLSYVKEYKPLKEEAYSFADNRLMIVDEEISLSYTEVTAKELTVKELHYDTGELKWRAYFNSRNQIHGPSTFYAQDGKVLAQSWFIDGRREGKMIIYYSSGSLQSVRRFVDNNKHGIQEYYYPHGLPKAVNQYVNGRLEGEQLFFYKNSKTKRKLHYRKGLRNGKEEIWSVSGEILAEAEFRDGKPIGKAVKWFSNGKLASEIVYNENSEIVSNKRWSIDGSLIEQEETGIFNIMTAQIDQLTKNLDIIFHQLEVLAPLFGAEHAVFKEKFENLSAQLTKLKELSDLIGSETEKHKEEFAGSEPLWATEENKKMLMKIVGMLNKQLKEEMQKIFKFIETKKEIIEKEQNKEKDEQQ